MNKHKCSLCGYVYDPKTEKKAFSEQPKDYVCPMCGADKDAFEKCEEEKDNKKK